MRLLEEEKNIPHEARDDIESFIHVLLWTAVCHAPNSMTPKHRFFLLQAFDHRNADAAATAKQSILLRQDPTAIMKLETLHFDEVLSDIVQRLAYQYVERWKGVSQEEIDHKERLMRTHTWMAKYLDNALKNPDWEETKDGGVTHDIFDPAIAAQDAQVSRKRRNASLSQYGREDEEFKRARIEDNAVITELLSLA